MTSLFSCSYIIQKQRDPSKAHQVKLEVIVKALKWLEMDMDVDEVLCLMFFQLPMYGQNGALKDSFVLFPHGWQNCGLTCIPVWVRFDMFIYGLNVIIVVIFVVVVTVSLGVADGTGSEGGFVG